MRKLLVVLIFLAALTATTSAYEMEMEDTTVNYDGEVSVEVSCTGDCPEFGYTSGSSVSLNVCREEADSTGGFGRSTSEPYSFSFHIPEDASCGIGEKRVRVGAVTAGTLTVEPKNTVPSQARNMVVNINMDQDTLRNFHLTDRVWDPSSWNPTSHDHGVVMVQAYDYLGADTPGVDYHYGDWVLRPGDDPVWSGDQTLAEFIDNNSGPYSSVQSGAEDVTELDFGYTDSFEYGDVEDNWGIDMQTPLHEDGEYDIYGDLILGYTPYFCPDEDRCVEGGEGPYFFACRAEKPMIDNGYEEVPMVVDTDPDPYNSDLYRCDSDYEWKEVGECGSGLDHDGDGRIDALNSRYHATGGERDDDPSCETASEDKLSSVSCQGAVLTDVYEEIGPAPASSEEWVAQYVNEDGECTTDQALNTWDHEHLILSEWREGEPQGGGAFDDVCLEDGVEFGGVCDQVNWDGNPYSVDEGGPGEMPVTAFYPEPEYLKEKALQDGVNLDAGEAVKTGFVDHEGWTHQEQTLWDAERKYMDAGDEHNVEEWAERSIKEPELSESYLDTETPDGDVETNEDVWRPTNAGEAPFASTGFEGGFAPRCSNGEFWQESEQIWNCDGTLTEWHHPIVLPLGDDFSDETTEVGLVVMPYVNLGLSEDHLDIFRDPTAIDGTGSDTDRSNGQSYTQAYFAQWGEVDRLETISELKCWNGGVDDRPDAEQVSEEEGEYFTAEDISVKDDAPFGYYEEVEWEHLTRYSCWWKYDTEKSVDETSGSIENLHMSFQKVTDYRDAYEIEPTGSSSRPKPSDWLD